MKRLSAASIGASVLPLCALAGAAPRIQTIDPNNLEISVLGGSTFRLYQVANEQFNYSYRGPRALGKAFQKFGSSFPEGLQEILQQILGELGTSVGGTGQINGQDADQGQVSAVPQMFDSEYLAAVQIGTPPQTLMLDFDTGSSDLWVFSSETPRIDRTSQTVYNIDASSTAKRLSGAEWSITYGDGSGSSGDVWLDTVRIGALTVENQAVESALEVSDSFTNDTASSGLLGLAFNSLNQVLPTKQKTFFANAMETIAIPLFTANLKAGEAGNYNFGFLDTSEFSGHITFVDVNATSGFWQFTSDGYRVGNGDAVALPHTAIADTGTTLLMLPEGIVEAYYAQVPSAVNNQAIGGYVFDCGETLPDFTASIGGYSAVVPGSLINFAPADSGSFETATLCFGGIQPSATLPFAIYGDIFLKSQFVVFEGGSTQLGFAAKTVGKSSAGT